MADAHGLYGQGSSEASQLLATFWPRVMNEVRTKPFNIHKSGNKKDEPIQELPLARIKKIMKQDGEVKMISAEAPILFSKAAEIFISELSLRAWIHTEDNKRRTLQRNDIAMAITKYDQFDFLIDIVPRDELKPAKRQEDGVRQSSNVMAPEQIQYYVQLAQLQQQAGTSTASPGGSSAVAGTTQLTQLPPGAHIIQQANGQLMIIQPAQLQNLTGTSTNAHLVQIPAGDQSATPGHTSLHQQLNPQTSAAGKGHGTAVGTQASQGSQVSGSQLQYIRIPQVPFIQSQQSQQQHQQAQGAQQQQQGAQQQQQGAQQHAGGQVSQGITAQVLQFHALNQLTQQQATSSASSAGQDGATQQVTDSGYSQIYHSIPGLPQGTIYVMAQAATSAGDQADGQE